MPEQFLGTGPQQGTAVGRSSGEVSVEKKRGLPALSKSLGIWMASHLMCSSDTRSDAKKSQISLLCRTKVPNINEEHHV